jgi:hypothetical protein
MFDIKRINLLLDRLGILVAVVLLSGCYVGPETVSALSSDAGPQVYKLYPGGALAESEIVKVNLNDAYYAIFDGFKVAKADYQQVLLMPGKHEIRWGNWFAISVMVDPEMLREGGGEAVAELIAGHTYELCADRTTGHGYKMFFWIQDSESGDVIAGTRKP